MTNPPKPHTIILLVILFAISALVSLYLFRSKSSSTLSPISKLKQIARPLDSYTFDALSNRQFQASTITLEEIIQEEDKFTSHLFSFTSEGKKVTGQINLPTDFQDQKLPAIIMLRGWIDPATYETGDGTKNAATVFAGSNFITIAPDFLGYGGSGIPDLDTFTARLQKPVTVLNLLASVKTLDYVDSNNILIWGHSNGGQIALSILEVTELPIPTTLWAPVSKPFPYSILYYTDESEDRGKALRKSLAQFEQLYDVDLYSIHNYYDQIIAPVQIHQGGRDDAVPLEWSNELADALEQVAQDQTASDSAALSVDYYTYPTADHNLHPNWNAAVSRDLSFFKKHLN